MKMKKVISLMMSGILTFAFSSCKNADRTFPDYEGGTSVYFAYQYPVRTLVLGNDEVVDNSRDQQHKCAIYATMGGAYNGRDITIDIDVDNSLCDNRLLRTVHRFYLYQRIITRCLVIRLSLEVICGAT